MPRAFPPAWSAFRLRAVFGAAWRRVGAWAEKIAAALREPGPQSPEDYERELRERVFHPPQL